MSSAERAVTFCCEADQLIGVVTDPREPFHRGVLIVVGGPQYRAGSHRQFTLLCRALAAQGIAAMRFDNRSMGDSVGSVRNFEDIGPDIGVAIDRFFQEVPALREVVIWGLCDAASAALMYAHRDTRVTGLVLLNPWVRTAEGLAKAQLKHYYWSRLLDRAFWQKVMRGEFAVASSAASLVNALTTALGIGKAKTSETSREMASQGISAQFDAPLPERMADGLHRFKGRALLILSGKDLTAQEFEDVVGRSKRWRQLLANTRVSRHKLPEANHTFSTRVWRDQVALWTTEWVRAW